MFTAEHLYTPASPPFKFFKSRVPPATADWFIFVWLFNLLHVIEGLGFPVAELWNLADPLSFTVDLAGETASEGAEIDSPGSPLDPGIPKAPCLLFVLRQPAQQVP